MSRRRLALLLTLTCGAPSLAHGGTFEGSGSSFFLGNVASMTGGAGVAVLEDADAAWLNPAGLATVRRSSLSLNANAFMLRLRKVPDYLVFSAGDERSTSDLDSRQLVTAPTAIVSVRKLSEHVTLALGLHTPRSDQTSSDHKIRLNVPDEDGGQLLFDGREQSNFRVLEHRVGAALGWRASRWLDLGARVSVVYLSTQERYRATESERSNTDGTTPPTDVYMGTSGGSFEQSFFGLAATLSARARLPGRWQLGLVVRSPVMVVYDRTAETSDDAFVAGSAADGTLDAGYDYQSSNAREGEGVWLLGETRVALGLSHPLGQGWFAVDGELRLATGDGVWAESAPQTWDVRAGLYLPVHDKLHIGAGVFTDRSIHAAAVQARDAQVNYYGATLGAVTDKRFDTSDGGTLVVRTTVALRYAAGLGTVVAEQYDAAANQWQPQPRSVVFHEVSVQLGSAIHF